MAEKEISPAKLIEVVAEVRHAAHKLEELADRMERYVPGKEDDPRDRG